MLTEISGVAHAAQAGRPDIAPQAPHRRWSVLIAPSLLPFCVLTSFLKIMTSINSSQAERPSVPLPLRAALGAVAAAILVYLVSAVHADPSMRVVPIVAFVVAAGTIGAIFTLTDPIRRRGARRAAKALSVLIFFLVIKVAFVVARHGPV